MPSPIDDSDDSSFFGLGFLVSLPGVGERFVLIEGELGQLASGDVLDTRGRLCVPSISVQIKDVTHSRVSNFFSSIGGHVAYSDSGVSCSLNVYIGWLNFISQGCSVVLPFAEVSHGNVTISEAVTQRFCGRKFGRSASETQFHVVRPLRLGGSEIAIVVL